MGKNKDPAFLFYPSDFIVGTRLMSFEQKGKYIELLCLQHQQGALSYEDMLTVCGEYDARIFSKFQKTEDGLYFNARLEEERRKRERFCTVRQENGAKGGRPKKPTENLQVSGRLSQDEPTENLLENENINKNIDKSIDKDTKAIKHKYGLYSNVLLSDEDVTKLQAEFPIDWTDRIERLSEYIASSGKTYKSHLATIRSWAKTDADKPRHDEPKKRYGDFDPVKALEDALRRSEELDD